MAKSIALIVDPSYKKSSVIKQQLWTEARGAHIYTVSGLGDYIAFDATSRALRTFTMVHPESKDPDAILARWEQLLDFADEVWVYHVDSNFVLDLAKKAHKLGKCRRVKQLPRKTNSLDEAIKADAIEEERTEEKKRILAEVAAKRKAQQEAVIKLREPEPRWVEAHYDGECNQDGCTDYFTRGSQALAIPVEREWNNTRNGAWKTRLVCEGCGYFLQRKDEAGLKRRLAEMREDPAAAEQHRLSVQLGREMVEA